MTENSTYRYYYGQRDRSTDAAARAGLNDRYFHASKDRFEDLVRPAGLSVPIWAQDLFRIAKATHLADRKSKRDVAVDKWTRHIDLLIQVQDCEPWQGSALNDLHLLLGTLTGDNWQVSLCPGAHTEGPQDALFHDDPVPKVALFSGGLDSTSYAAEQILAHHERLLFVTYSVPKLNRPQREIFDSIADPAHPPLRPIPQQVSGGDLSNRSRGFLFVATAIYAAATHRSEEVVVPENGQLAINSPLTPARLAACSTRSVHPRTLMLINRIIAAVSNQPLKVHNPYLRLTKGQVCRRALDAGLSPEVLAQTVSCGSPPILRRKDLPYHCGCCFPCLVRRSALLTSADIDTTAYARDFWEVESTRDTADDAYALRSWLSRPFTTRDLIADIPLPPNVKPADLMPMLVRGRKELSHMIEELVPSTHPFRRGRATYVTSTQPKIEHPAAS
jgi:hypothetical protein